MDAQMDRDLNTRWQKLVAPRTTTTPSSSSRPDVLSTTQAKIREFFNFIGSSSQPAISSFSIPIIPEGISGNVTKVFLEGNARMQKIKEAGDNKEVEPNPFTSPIGGTAGPRRINPVRVSPLNAATRVRSCDGPEETIDLVTESSVPSRGSRSMFGTTTISETEAQNIKNEVRTIMAEQIAEGRAALRAELGLPARNAINDEAAAALRLKEVEMHSAESEAKSVPRSSFGSLVSVTDPVPSTTMVLSAQPSFATAAWKPKEPPCFFGRSTEDAHTWVSLVRNYLTFMSGSDSAASGVYGDFVQRGSP